MYCCSLQQLRVLLIRNINISYIYFVQSVYECWLHSSSSRSSSSRVLTAVTEYWLLNRVLLYRVLTSVQSTAVQSTSVVEERTGCVGWLFPLFCFFSAAILSNLCSFLSCSPSATRHISYMIMWCVVVNASCIPDAYIPCTAVWYTSHTQKTIYRLLSGLYNRNNQIVRK